MRKKRIETKSQSFIYERPITLIAGLHTDCILCSSGSDINEAGEETDDIFGE